jgi:hypothetical protein
MRVLHFGAADLGMPYNLEDVGSDDALWVAATGTVEMPGGARLLLADHSSPLDLSRLANRMGRVTPRAVSASYCTSWPARYRFRRVTSAENSRRENCASPSGRSSQRR